MITVRTPADLAAALATDRDRRVAFVPTMGSLHEGHLSLVRLARARGDVVVVSIFVNPLQFGPAEDLADYPGDEDRDLRLLAGEDVDIAFLPTVEDMYPDGAVTTVSVGPLGSILEGAHRPGHFDGVATVVAKLFHMVEPDVAVFGQKDGQQVAVIRQMIADLDFRVELAIGPIVRETDGVALSSRNVYLGPEERVRARVLHRALQTGGGVLRAGDDAAEAERVMTATLASEPGVDPAYAAAVDPATFQEPKPSGPALLLVAVRVGTTRLIDNMLVEL
ncbi:MAG: pantoate--beta-alanine ligase [Actinomycetota bacterium]